MKSKIMAMGATLLLAACGFHLKGTLPQNALAVKEWRVQGGGIQAELQAELQRAAASVNPQASAEVHVLSVDSKRDIYSHYPRRQIERILVLAARGGTSLSQRQSVGRADDRNR